MKDEEERAIERFEKKQLKNKLFDKYLPPFSYQFRLLRKNKDYSQNNAMYRMQEMGQLDDYEPEIVD